ncbi:MAG: hypothetical protein IKF64_05260 [Eubacterium sp.]|nr:hypothetical protein [Eubacterium sp.]
MISIDKKELRHIIKVSVKILSFALVFVLIVEILSLTTFSKKNAANYKTALNKAYAFLKEPDNTIDVLGIGNSDLYSSVVPAQLWSDYGYTCSLISSPRQTPQKSYKMLQTFYEKQKPSVVIIEIDMLYDDMVADRADIVNDENMLDFFFDRMSSDALDNYVYDIFPLFTFHDKWKKAGKGDDIPDSHGYKYSSDLHRVKIGDYMKYTDKKEPIKLIHSEYLKEMVNYCKEQGSSVILMESPSITSWNYERHNAAQELADESGVEFIDLNLLPDEIGVDLNMAFRDKGNHLNYFSACEVTKLLGKYISTHFEMTDRRGDSSYKFYDDSIKRFYKQIAPDLKKYENV